MCVDSEASSLVCIFRVIGEVEGLICSRLFDTRNNLSAPRQYVIEPEHFLLSIVFIIVKCELQISQYPRQMSCGGLVFVWGSRQIKSRKTGYPPHHCVGCPTIFTPVT